MGQPTVTISGRVRGISPSSTLAVSQRAAELKRAGVDVLAFASGEPDFVTPEVVRQAAIKALRDGMTGYAPVPGDPATREAVAAKLTSENEIPGVTADHVVISPGAKQSLFLLFQSLLDPGDEVVLPTPSWLSYEPQIELAGGVVKQVPTDRAGGFKMTADQLEAAINQRTRLVVLNTPSNPCGTAYSRAELDSLAAVIRDAPSKIGRDVFAVCDEIYEKLVYRGHEHVSLASLDGMAERTVTVNGMSKAFAMTGWRLGYLAGSGPAGLKIAGACKTMQSQLNTSVATFTLPAMRVALTECAADVERMRTAFEARGSVMHELLSAIDGVDCPVPEGAFYCFADVAAHFGKRAPSGEVIENADGFAAALLDAQHVAGVAGTDFGPPGERCMRFTFACGEDQIREGMARLASFISSLT